MITTLAPPTGNLALGILEVDTDSYRAWVAGRLLALSRSQVELLAIMIANRHRVLSRVELAKALRLERPRSVDVLLSGLRRQIDRPFVRNVRNRGWIVEPNALTQ